MKPEHEDLVVAVRNFFRGDIGKAMLWWQTPNPMLGGISPAQMLELRPDKLRKFIETSLEENRGPDETP